MELPQSVKQENNPEVLKALIASIVDKNEKLEKELICLQAEKFKKDQHALKLDDELLLARKRMFGKSSEKRSGRDGLIA